MRAGEACIEVRTLFLCYTRRLKYANARFGKALMSAPMRISLFLRLWSVWKEAKLGERKESAVLNGCK